MNATDLIAHATLTTLVELILTLGDSGALDLTAFSEAVARCAKHVPPGASEIEAEKHRQLMDDLSRSLLQKSQARRIH